ncbi:hypothetical protein Tco_1441969, partial [Tanacetum coccineum]
NFLELVWILHIGPPGYGVSDLLDTAYQTYWLWRIELLWYRVFGSLGTAYWATMFKPELQLMTPGSISSELVQNPSSSTSYVPPTKIGWDILFQPMFDEYFQPSPSGIPHVSLAVAPIPTNTTGTPSST